MVQALSSNKIVMLICKMKKLVRFVAVESWEARLQTAKKRFFGSFFEREAHEKGRTDLPHTDHRRKPSFSKTSTALL